ncbi:MAG: TonB-dependent receptor [Comamonadaceae bacterium]|nr:MAG: TonB-dependent receptor [Comamonadaceae bacterium]
MKIRAPRTRLVALPLALAAAFPVVSLLSLAPFPALAQDRPTPQLAETVVTASRNEQPLGAALPHTTVISREDIERSQATDLLTLLQRETGLQRTQNGGIGSTSTVFLRGSASLNTLVLVDGVPQNKQDASGAVSLEHIMLDTVERVEIVRGNVSAIYGSGAIGGVIQIFTKAGSRTSSANLSLELGPRNSRKTHAGISASAGESGATSFSADVSRFRTDGFSAINNQQQPGANPDADGYTNTSVNLAATHRLSKDHSFGFKLFHSKGDTDYDNAFGAPGDLQNATTRLSQATVFSDNTFGDWRSRVSLSEQADKSRNVDNGVFGSTDEYTTKATILNWTNTVAVGAGWLATAGLEFQRQRVETTSSSPFNGVYDRKRNASALFAGLEGKVLGGDLQANVRGDKVGDLDKTTGYLGYGYPLTPQVKAIGSVSTAFNAPPLGYLFAPGFGNPLLRPERAKSSEIGLQYASGSQLVRATWFDTRVKDQIVYDFVTNAFANVSRAKNEGLEVSYKGTVGQADLRADVTLQDPVDETTSQRLNRRAATLASLGASYPFGALRVGGDVQYTGERKDGTRSLAAYTLVNLTGAYRLTQEVDLKLRLDNATDRQYQTVYGYNQQPRSLYVGLSWTPKF